MSRPLLIGHCLNASGSRRVAAALHRRDAATIAQIAGRQADAGADYLDLCAAGQPDEAGALSWLVETAQTAASLPVSLDSPNPAVVRAVLPLCRQPPLLNVFYSASLAEPNELTALLRENSHLAVVAACTAKGQPPRMSAERLDIAHRLAAELLDIGLLPSQVVFDPVTLPGISDPDACATTLETIRALRRHFPLSRILCAVGNYGYGHPARRAAERAFAAAALNAGADIFLYDPSHLTGEPFEAADCNNLCPH